MKIKTVVEEAFEKAKREKKKKEKKIKKSVDKLKIDGTLVDDEPKPDDKPKKEAEEKSETKEDAIDYSSGKGRSDEIHATDTGKKFEDVKEDLGETSTSSSKPDESKKEAEEKSDDADSKKEKEKVDLSITDKAVIKTAGFVGKLFARI